MAILEVVMAMVSPRFHAAVQEEVMAMVSPPSHAAVQEELGSSVEPPRSWRDFGMAVRVAVLALVLLSIILFAPEGSQPLQDLESLVTNPRLPPDQASVATSPWSSCNHGVGGSRPEQLPASAWFLLRRLVPHRGRPPESPLGDPGAWRPGRPPDLSTRTPAVWWPGHPFRPPLPVLIIVCFFRLGTSGSRDFEGGYCHDPGAPAWAVRVSARLL
ncbi:uncharacterized protein LOC133512463 isoform X2 [Syngnathoides biaculeatus]|uniref:uncharacterized protein LOC133512463 isoform X2 n=1 Tax=Syngnathoides biaculeatus TaxID=300417 RepID=UPI002ADE8197|nr:uncharacterized protein LOC133512463 isoform X2 [Syngnathoides biaculeatus]